ncbi:hypothetical protein [Alkalihalobacterium elongatum]|uniref:hypothetical protein n=1 Tax=Alkalihalobacterium elongatum TaxID=2675466 RepID=UPI001C1F8571|nr:hypothetical protein [Alkalihalobacterium elongatum]
MWKIVPICEDIFGLWAEQSDNDAWTATMILKESHYQIEIIAEIHISYLNHMDEVDNLLNEIRDFSNFIKKAKEKEYGEIHFHCKGISTFNNSYPLPSFSHSSGLTFIDTEFTEELHNAYKTVTI